MERLTHERNNGIKTGYWSPNKKDELVSALAAYENTGLTTQEIMELKDRDTAKAPIDADEDYGFFICPSCDMAIGTVGDKKNHHFCLNCGQRIRWEE